MTYFGLFEYVLYIAKATLVSKLMGATWGPPVSCRPKVGPM